MSTAPITGRIVQERATRRLTGLPAWPIGLLTGPEKTGKTYQAVQAATSDLVGGSFWIAIGEDVPDEYGALPGAMDRVQVVSHDGTRRDILAAIEWAVNQPPLEDGKPNLVSIDSMSRLWNLMVDELQAEANQRERRKAAKYNRRASEGDQQITMDLWNLGKQRWVHIMDALRSHHGPVLLLARLDVVTVMDDAGQPTKEKDRKVQAEKTLPFDVGFIVDLPAPGEAVLTGVRSLKVKAATGQRTAYPGFSVDKLWRDLGLDGHLSERSHGTVAVPEEAPTVDDLLLRITADDLTVEQAQRIWQVANHFGMLDAPINATETLGQRIDQVGRALAAAGAQATAGQGSQEPQQQGQVPQ